AECRAGVGIFTDWSLAQRDLITHDMRMIIRDRSVSPIGVGVPRADWDDVIGERLRPVYGSIDYAAIGISEEKAMTRAGDRLIITFDEGSEGSRLISEFAAEADRLVVIEQAPVKSTPALQAADLIAWEFLRYGREWLRDPDHLPWPHLKEWAASGELRD